jgi:hypothetical protein
MREWREEVLLGMMRPSSWRVEGRSGDMGCAPLRDDIVLCDGERLHLRSYVLSSCTRVVEQTAKIEVGKRDG